MCGVAGCLEFKSGKIADRESIEKMTRFMLHRGPDGEGIVIDKAVALGHRRLSIIDIAHGDQPMWSSCKRYCLCFNGEIYNYIELKKELEGRGYSFNTSSDTEVLLNALIEYGTDVLPRLNGMFAFAFWDSQEQQMLLARDHLGIKPLYYYKDNNRLLFASDVGALACHKDFPRKLCEKAISHFFSWRVIPNPYTAFDNTWQLMPGHFLVIKQKGDLVSRQYWDIPVHNQTQNEDPVALEQELEGLLEDAMRLQVRSDVPVGAFLSGGVDSSTVSYWMKQAVSDPVTFTIGFDGKDKEFDESEWAKDVAQHIGTQHHLHVLQQYAMEPLLDRAAHFFNHPCGTGIPNYFVSALASKHVKVGLAGVGGDELFAGYGRFSSSMKHNDPEYAFLRSLMSYTEQDKQTMFHGDFFTQVRDEPSLEYIRQQSAGIKTKEMVNKLCYMDLKHFMLNDLLFNLDKMSMAHSLEVRVPLLDYRIVEFAMRVPPALKMRRDLQKILLKRAMYKHLPNHVFMRPKRGFSLPKQIWVPKMEPYIRSLINKKNIENRGVFDWKETSVFLDNLFKNERVSWRDANNVWNMFNFELWASKFLDHAPDLSPPPEIEMSLEEVK